MIWEWVWGLEDCGFGGVDFGKGRLFIYGREKREVNYFGMEFGRRW